MLMLNNASVLIIVEYIMALCREVLRLSIVYCLDTNPVCLLQLSCSCSCEVNGKEILVIAVYILHLFPNLSLGKGLILYPNLKEIFPMKTNFALMTC